MLSWSEVLRELSKHDPESIYIYELITDQEFKGESFRDNYIHRFSSYDDLDYFLSRQLARTWDTDPTLSIFSHNIQTDTMTIQIENYKYDDEGCIEDEEIHTILILRSDLNRYRRKYDRLKR